MRSSFSKIKGKDVITTSGAYLGQVRDIVFDMNTQMIVQYEVSKFPFPNFFGEDKHLINHKQIAAFKEEAVVVKDARLNTAKDKKQDSTSESAIMTKNKQNLDSENSIQS